MDDRIGKMLQDPYISFLGIEVNKAGKGYARCSLRITKNMINFNGVVHGGLVFSLADAAFSIASNCDHLPSLALDVSGSFLQAAQVDDILTAEAQLIHTTKRTGFYRMDVYRKTDLMATFNGTVFRKVK
jgi:acyl-CoA thioesterase